MQERVNEKTVAVAVQATKMSGRMIARIGEMYLRHGGITGRSYQLTLSTQKRSVRSSIRLTR